MKADKRLLILPLLFITGGCGLKFKLPSPNDCGISSNPSPNGLTINLNCDASVLNSPLASQIELSVNKAAQILESTYTNHISITIDVGWGEENGNALCADCLGQSQYMELNNSFSLNSIEQYLSRDPLSSYDQTAYTNFPTSMPGGNAGITLTSAQGRAFGLISGQSVDGYVGFNSAYSYTFDDSSGVPAGTYDLTGIAIHEMTEVMGRTSGAGTFQTNVTDLFRYESPGVISFTKGSKAYFSIDGGITDLSDYNSNSSGDSGDWYGFNVNDALNAFTSDGFSVTFTQVDKILLNVIGYTTGSYSYTQSQQRSFMMTNSQKEVKLSNIIKEK